MFRNSQTVVSIFGVEIRIAASWILIAALITWSFAQQVFPNQIPGLSEWTYLALGLIAMCLFFGSLVLHELAHAMTAQLVGISVPRITLFLFGGVAEMDEEPQAPTQELWIALAGPVMSAALAVTFWALSKIALAFDAGTIAGALLSHLALVNLVLAIFNLLPAFPLDGGRVLRAFLWARSGSELWATETAVRAGTVLAYALIGLGLLSLFQGEPIGGAWQVMIGVFILFLARNSLDDLRIRSALGDDRVSDLMSKTAVTVSPDVSLSELVNRIMLPTRMSFVPVVEGAILLGHIDAEVLSKIDRENWANTRVGDVFVELQDQTRVSPGLFAKDLIYQISQTGRRKFLVTKGHRLLGVVTLSDMSRYIALLSDLHLDQRSADTT